MPFLATERQRLILNTVRSLTRDFDGIPPTIAEIARRASLPRSSTYRYIDTLCLLGLLRRADSGSRGVCRILTRDCYG